MESYIKLKIKWAAGAIRITEDGRPWLVEKGTCRRLVWKIFCRLPAIRVHSQWISARMVARDAKFKSLQVRRDRQVEHYIDGAWFVAVPRLIERETLPFENPSLNRAIRECFEAEYFTKPILKRMDWTGFRVVLEDKGMKRTRAVRIPQMETRVLQFMEQAGANLSTPRF